MKASLRHCSKCSVAEYASGEMCSFCGGNFDFVKNITKRSEKFPMLMVVCSVVLVVSVAAFGFEQHAPIEQQQQQKHDEQMTSGTSVEYSTDGKTWHVDNSQNQKNAAHSKDDGKTCVIPGSEK